MPRRTDLRQRLLVIDDDSQIRALFTDLFDDRYEVETAPSGADGLDAILRRRPALVLLDLTMPGMHGIEVLQAIKRLDKGIPVIIVTGSSEMAVAQQALDDGAFAYLPKPFQFPFAEHLVAAALAVRSAAAGSAGV